MCDYHEWDASSIQSYKMVLNVSYVTLNIVCILLLQN